MLQTPAMFQYFLGIIRRIIISWMLTLPVAAVTSIIIYIALKGIIL